MHYLLDTDTLSALLRPRPNLVLARKLATEPAEAVFTSAITAGELVYGAARFRPALLPRVEAMLARLPVVSFNEASAYAYGTLRAELDGGGLVLAEADLRIAAIALAHDMVVVTGNTKHFAQLPGLAVENWLS